MLPGWCSGEYVSTHSHPKVAAQSSLCACRSSWFQHTATRRWLRRKPTAAICNGCFNTQPPEGGCPLRFVRCVNIMRVSTHSHPKVAACRLCWISSRQTRFNTQPPEGGCMIIFLRSISFIVSTHSHPKVAAPTAALAELQMEMFQHTATRRWLPAGHSNTDPGAVFQHTATRRWLPVPLYRKRLPNWFQHTATRRWLQPPSKALLHQVSQPRFR